MRPDQIRVPVSSSTSRRVNLTPLTMPSPGGPIMLARLLAVAIKLDGLPLAVLVVDLDDIPCDHRAGQFAGQVAHVVAVGPDQFDLAVKARRAYTRSCSICVYP